MYGGQSRLLYGYQCINSQIPCPTGKYNPVSGANSSAMCLDADQETSRIYSEHRLRLHVPQGSISLTADKNHACRPIQETLSNHQGKIAKKNVSSGSINLIQPSKIVSMPIQVTS